MNRNDVVQYLNSTLHRKANINREDLAIMCTVIEDETRKVFKVNDVVAAARANPNKMMRYLEAVWGFLLHKYNIKTRTSQIGIPGQFKIVDYS